MERTLGGALVVMRRQLGARFHKCLKSDKPQKVLIKNLPLDFQNVQWGAVGWLRHSYAIPTKRDAFLTNAKKLTRSRMGPGRANRTCIRKGDSIQTSNTQHNRNRFGQTNTHTHKHTELEMVAWRIRYAMKRACLPMLKLKKFDIFD